MNLIAIAVVLVVGTGLVAAVILSYASKVFFVPVDELFGKLRPELPGANCGGCGFAGCDDYANALVEDHSISCSLCPVGGPDLANKLAEIMGVSAELGDKEVAVVQCNGTLDAAKSLMKYDDIKTCKAAKQIFGGMNACPYGCMGLGDCEASCDFDSIQVVNGVATVNRDTCTSCGACVTACPNSLIRISTAKNLVIVQCSNTDKGATARKACSNACIGCMKCVKACRFDAVKVENFLAYIDPVKCTNCGLCAKECPTHAIVNLRQKKKAVKKPAPKVQAEVKTDIHADKGEVKSAEEKSEINAEAQKDEVAE